MSTKVQRQSEYLRLLAEHDGRTEAAAAAMGVSPSTVRGWKDRDPSFARRHETVKAKAKSDKIARDLDANVFDPNRKIRAVPPFTNFRREYLGRPVAAHQEAWVRAWEDTTNLVVVILAPAGGGKDTTAGDIVAWEVAKQNGNRIAWVMESEKFSKRRFERFTPLLYNPRAYVKPQGPDTSQPVRSMIEDFGPFQWKSGMKYPDGSKVPRPTWTKNEVYFLGYHDEADPNLWATGISGSMYGSRIDIAVISDPFTQENQQSPTVKAQQIDWIFGTFLSRLDDQGRLLVLGTRVSPGDNYEVLMNKLVGDAPVVVQDGYYTKYANGVATVISPAISYDESGQEVSYWPDKFPLRSKLILPATAAKMKKTLVEDRTFYTDELDPEDILELSKQGARRVRGLREMRDRDPSLFELMYQQNASTDSSGEFTKAILDHCDDPSRTFGVYRPGKTLVLGVDPARTAGAAWVLWEYDQDSGQIALVDFFYGEKLGVVGIKEKLLLDPILRYLPRYTCYEINRDEAVLELPEVIQSIKATSTELIRHQTNINRTQGDTSVASMVFDMRSGVIRFPAATVTDKERMGFVKQHFQNWDMRQSIFEATGRRRQQIPDDVAMAAWVGWYKIKELAKRNGRRHMPQREVPMAVQRKWVHQSAPSADGPAARPVMDLVDAFFGGEG